MSISKEVAKKVAKQLGINFKTAGYTLDEFRYGMKIELEHGKIKRKTNITNDDPLLTGKIALAHLNESPYYYVGLRLIEHIMEHYSKPKQLELFKTIKKMI